MRFVSFAIANIVLLFGSIFWVVMISIYIGIDGWSSIYYIHMIGYFIAPTIILGIVFGFLTEEKFGKLFYAIAAIFYAVLHYSLNVLLLVIITNTTSDALWQIIIAMLCPMLGQLLFALGFFSITYLRKRKKER